MKTAVICYALGCLSMFFALKFFKPPQATPGHIDTVAVIKEAPIIQKTKDSVAKVWTFPIKKARQHVRTALFDAAEDQLSPFSMDSLNKAIKELPRRTLNDISRATIKADAYDTLEMAYVKMVNKHNSLVVDHNDLLRSYAQLNATIKQQRRRRWRNIGIAAGAGLLIGILIAK